MHELLHLLLLSVVVVRGFKIGLLELLLLHHLLVKLLLHDDLLQLIRLGLFDNLGGLVIVLVHLLGITGFLVLLIVCLCVLLGLTLERRSADH